MAIARIKKNDTVIVASGVDAGKVGKVESIDPKAQTAIVKGVNIRKKAVRRSETNEGGHVSREFPVRLCKLMPYDEEKKCGTRVRTGEDGGKKVRVSVKSGKTL